MLEWHGKDTVNSASFMTFLAPPKSTYTNNATTPATSKNLPGSEHEKETESKSCSRLEMPA